VAAEERRVSFVLFGAVIGCDGDVDDWGKIATSKNANDYESGTPSWESNSSPATLLRQSPCVRSNAKTTKPKRDLDT